ncbi:MAG: ribonuclease HI family protein [Gemmatimonadota bacterium]
MRSKAFVLRTDGAARGNPGPAGAGAVLEDAEGHVLVELSAFVGARTNNQAEYEALLLGLGALLERESDSAGRCRVTAFLDSELVVRQLEGRYRVKDPALRELFDATRRLATRLGGFGVRHVPREENRRADELANLAIDRELAAPDPTPAG